MDVAPPPASSTVQELLLTEARAEIGRLRTESFQSKRLAEERQRALQSLQAERDQLLLQCHQLQSHLGACQARIQQLQGVEAQMTELQQAQQKLKQEHELSQRARRILQEELADERKQRKQVEEAKAVLESERSRHQRAKDDLAMSLRVARKKAEEAAEEQLRAEQEAAQLRSELGVLQSGGMEGTEGSRVGGESSASNSRNNLMQPLPLKTLLPGSEQVAIEEALRAAEYERCRAESLTSRLAAAEEELASASQEVQSAEELWAELHSARRALHQLQAEQHQHRYFESTLVHQKAQLHREQQHQPSDTHPPPSDQQQVPGGVNTSQPTLLEAQAEIEILRAKVAKFRASRDKLLEQVDKQWEELDRAGMETKAAQDELAITRRLAANWEAQAQDSLAHVERLKEMLEEASTWGNNGNGGPQAAPRGIQEASDTSSPQGDGIAAGMHVTEAALLQEKARCTEMELTARALAAELLRAQHASISMGKAMLPALTGIEYRLNGMLRSQTLN